MFDSDQALLAGIAKAVEAGTMVVFDPKACFRHLDLGPQFVCRDCS